MPGLDLILAPALAPDDLIGLELHLLNAVAAQETPPLLLIYASPGRCVSIGRYHTFCAPPKGDGIKVIRRLTGGRVVGAGDGWLWVALILPTRSALLGEGAVALKPEQVINRYARGILAGMRALGIEAFYPGRDAITVDAREIAMCTFETAASGAMLFESAIAHRRGMEDLLGDLERIDSGGSLSCRVYDAASATSVARELARDLPFDELARAIASGYEALLGPARRRELTAAEFAAARRSALALAGEGRSVRPAAETSSTLRNRISSQLGAIEAEIALKEGRIIASTRLSGDFIANSPAIAELESELCGRPLNLASVADAVTRTFARNGNFFLGAGELENLVRLIAEVH